MSPATLSEPPHRSALTLSEISLTGGHGICEHCFVMLAVAIIVFLGLTVSANTLLDRLIYGALTAASVGALIYYRYDLALFGWFGK